MSCYPVIGLRSICEVPEASYYLNDLPEFTFKSLAKIANEEQVTAAELFNEVYAAACKFVRADVVNNFPTFKTILASAEYGKEATTYAAIDDGLKGIYIESFECCKYVRAYIKTLKVLTNTTRNTKPIYVYEGSLNSEPTEYAVNLTAGEWSEIQIKLKSDEPEVWILWDTCDIEVNDGTIGKAVSNCGCGCNPCNCNPYMSVRGWDGSAENSKNYGLFPVIDAVCCEEAMMCDISKFLDRLILYKMATMISEQAIYSDRWTNYLIYNKDRFKDIVLKYMGGIDPKTGDKHKGEYYKELESILTRINDYLRSEGECCFDCDVGSFKFVRP